MILGHYRIKEIHRGGMGLVFRVQPIIQTADANVDLAVKSPRPEFFRDETDKQNFEREATTWAELGFLPNIVPCFFVCRLAGIPHIVAEYIDGGNLAESIRSGKLYEGMPEQILDRILNIAVQVACGLHFAHSRGVIHQDVKPANIMMSRDGTVKITDFGVARARAKAGQRKGESSGTMLATCGGMTPAYCSPEQAEIAALAQAGASPETWPKLTRRSDIWSWAVSVLEMLTGEASWKRGEAAGNAVASLLRSVPFLSSAFVSMNSTHSDVSCEGLLKAEGVVALLQKCLQPAPENRPQDMLEVIRALQKIDGHAPLPDFSRAIARCPEAILPLAQRELYGRVGEDRS